MLEILKSAARASVALYPQYVGHFDNYVLVRVTRKFSTKSGLAFTKGEWTIAPPYRGGEYRTVWSARNEVDTSIPAKYVVEEVHA